MRNDSISVKIIIATAVCIAVLLFTSFFPVSLPQPSSHSTAVSLPCTATVSPTHSFYITINSTPKGNGTYQQLFTIGNSTDPFSNYGINSQGSNFLISYSNGTDAYSWIQSINTTSIKLWSKILNGTVRLDLNVYATTENLFNASGFLGYNNTYFNAPLIFNNNAWDYSYNFSYFVKSGSVTEKTTNNLINISFPADTSGSTWWLGNGSFTNGSKLYSYINYVSNASALSIAFDGSGYSFSNTLANNTTATATQHFYSKQTTSNEVIIGIEPAHVTPDTVYMLENWAFVTSTVTMPTYTITPQLNFTHTVYTYTVYIATVTNENPAYTASGLTNLTFKATGFSWAYFPSSDKLEVNPPPYLIFSNITGNYGVYNITMQMTATSNITHKTITATAYAEVTVIGYVRLNVTKITQSANSLFPTLTEREIMFLITAVVSIVVALILMSFVAERKVKRKEEEKYEKEWLKHD